MKGEWKQVKSKYTVSEAYYVGRVKTGSVGPNSAKARGSTGNAYVAHVALPGVNLVREKSYSDDREELKQRVENVVKYWFNDMIGLEAEGEDTPAPTAVYDKYIFTLGEVLETEDSSSYVAGIDVRDVAEEHPHFHRIECYGSDWDVERAEAKAIEMRQVVFTALQQLTAPGADTITTDNEGTGDADGDSTDQSG